MADYNSEEVHLLLMTFAKVLVMEHEPKDIVAEVEEDQKTFAVAGTAALISWLGEFITYLVLEDLPEEEVVDE